MACAPGDGWICERTAVHEKDVEPAIVIDVEEQAARSEDFREKLLVAGAADVRDVQPGRHRDISEHRQRRSGLLPLEKRRCEGCAVNSERDDGGDTHARGQGSAHR